MIPTEALPVELSLKDVLLSVERTLITSVLIACDWNQRRAAAALSLLPTTLSEKIHRLNIQPPNDRWSRENRAIGRRRAQPKPVDEAASRTQAWCSACGAQETRGRAAAFPARVADIAV